MKFFNNGWDKALNNITSNITITARWNPIVYTISYNLDGGTNNPDNPNSYTIETETIEFNYDTIKKRLKELAFLNKGLEICLSDARENEKEPFQHAAGR